MLAGTKSRPVLPDDRITSSSVADPDEVEEKWRLRLEPAGGGAFCLDEHDKEPWVEWDFGVRRQVAGMSLAGGGARHAWVESFRLEYLDGTAKKPKWSAYTSQGSAAFVGRLATSRAQNASRLAKRPGNGTLLPGAYARHDSVELRLEPFNATKVKLLVIDFVHEPCLRADFVGCRENETQSSPTYDMRSEEAKAVARRELGVRKVSPTKGMVTRSWNPLVPNYLFVAALAVNVLLVGLASLALEGKIQKTRKYWKNKMIFYGLLQEGGDDDVPDIFAEAAAGKTAAQEAARKMELLTQGLNVEATHSGPMTEALEGSR